MDPIILSVIAGFSTVIAGFLTSNIAKKEAKKEDLQKESIEKIASIVASNADKAKAKAFEAIISKLPESENVADFERKLIQNLQIRGDLVINNNTDTDAALVEDLVTGYHQQALSQARVQFWFSVAAATVGFVFIIYSSKSATTDNLSTVVSILPGAVIDAVALLFFRQAEQTRERATALYDRLRMDNQMKNAHTLVESIEDTQIKSAVKAQIALHMSGLKPKDIDLQTFMTSRQ